MSAWIKMIPLEEATGKLKDMYQLALTPSGTVDNVMRAHSLRPHSMEGHLVLYRSVLHNPDNTLPFWFLEVVASYVSMTNRCDYSLTHHFANARRLMNDPQRASWSGTPCLRPSRSGRFLARNSNFCVTPENSLPKSPRWKKATSTALRPVAAMTVKFWRSTRSVPISITPTACSTDWA